MTGHDLTGCDLSTALSILCFSRLALVRHKGYSVTALECTDMVSLRWASQVVS